MKKLVEDRQLWFSRQKVNEVSKRKKNPRGQNWKMPAKKKNISNGKNISRVRLKTHMKSFIYQPTFIKLNSNVRQVTEEKLDPVLKRFESRKVASV